MNEFDGTWPADDPRRIFVEGVKWWMWQTEHTTLFAAERRSAEEEAERRYPEGKIS